MKTVLTIIFFFCLSNVAFSKTKVGVLFRLQDKYNTFPRQMVQAIEFYLRENSGKDKVELIKQSHDGTPASLKKAVKQLVDVGVKVIIGGETSSDAIQISKYTENANIVFLSPTASSAKIHLYNKNSFRMMLDGGKMVRLVEEVIRTHKCKKLGVFHNLTKPNTSFISQKISDSFSEKVVEVKVLADQVNLEEKLKPFVEKKIDCLSLFSFESDFRSVYSILKKKGVFPILIGGDGWGTNQNVFSRYVNNNQGKRFLAYRALYWNSSRKDSFFINTKSKFIQKYHTPMTAFSAIAYDTAHVVVQSLDSLKEGTFDAAKLSNNIKSMTFESLLTTKSLKFDRNNSPVKGINAYIIDGKGVRFWREVRL